MRKKVVSLFTALVVFASLLQFSTAQAAEPVAIGLTDFDLPKRSSQERWMNYYGQNEGDGDRQVKVKMDGLLASGSEEAIVRYTVEQKLYYGPTTALCQIDPVGPLSGRLTFSNGSTEQMITIPIADDDKTECTEYYLITLEPETANAEVDPYESDSAVLYVFDDEPTVISFTHESSMKDPLWDLREVDGGESKRPVNNYYALGHQKGIVVLGDLSSKVSADIVYKDCGCTYGEDYIVKTSQFEFQPIHFDKSVDYSTTEIDPFFDHESPLSPFKSYRQYFEVYNDSHPEAVESFRMQLKNVKNAKLGKHQTAYVSITDTDGDYFTFGYDGVTLLYGDKNLSNIVLRISRTSSDKAASVRIRIAEDTRDLINDEFEAIPGIDYEAFEDQVLMFAPGETRKELTIQSLPTFSPAPAPNIWAPKSFHIELIEPSDGYTVRSHLLVNIMRPYNLVS
ncbi:Calx-beta domain-containing protein [Paenibacillus sambharensis]|nr:Calx-beta domain-containing protein [Paenibacillus sambharensis]